MIDTLIEGCIGALELVFAVGGLLFVASRGLS